MRQRKIITTVLLSVLAAALLAVSVACGEKTTATITYDTGIPGATVTKIESAIGSKIYPIEDPVRDGYRFEYWELNGTPYVFDVMPESDITLKAAWTKLYSIEFDTGENATTLYALQFAAGDTIEIEQTPTRSGYKFDGWEMDGEPFTLTEMPARDLTLTAKWKEAFTITFSTGAADCSVAPIVEQAGAQISAPEVHRAGYYLKNWKTSNGEVYKFNVMPSENITLVAEWSERLTNLPAMVVNLSDKSGNVIPLAQVTREEYVDSTITVTNTEEQYELFALKSSFKGRGNGSWTSSGDKKGYKIKFDKKQSLFGRAANKHWVVIACANFDDPTMSRNYLAYNMAGEVFTNIEYATQAHWIDLYVNDEYRGVYLLCEHVRVGDGRVDIESDYLSENFDSTGYLVEYDAYAEGVEDIDYFRVPGVKYAFTVHSPDPEDYAEEGVGQGNYMRQVAYIKNYVTRVYEAALSKNYTAFAELVDVDSFVDMYILHELFKNMDTGYSSFYLYKKPNGKLYAGPPWDFDATASADDGNGRGDRSPQGLYVSTGAGSDNTVCELFISLYQTSGFKNAIKARWKTLSPAIKSFLDERLNDEMYDEYKAAMGKNFAKWKNKSQTTAETDWVRDVKALKQWLLDRIAWLNTEWK